VSIGIGVDRIANVRHKHKLGRRREEERR